LNRSDGGIFRQCQEDGEERGGTTVEPSDAEMAENTPVPSGCHAAGIHFIARLVACHAA
jgi:hypothetical protein